MYHSFDIYTYSIDVLKDLLVKHTASSLPRVSEKLHSHYFEGYFQFIKAKTILVELRYVDHDFLEDFANYYVKCFKEISHKCTRLHFFQEEFTEEQFKKTLVGDESELSQDRLRGTYLGFIVLKSLPETIIGRTCLKTYPEETSTHSRHYPITRLYQVSLFGIDLSVDTLAFQEQDSVTAACATSALWSIFQGTGKLFQHAIPSPVEITKAATANVPFESRVIPNHGLNAQQMAQAIRKINLEPLLINVRDINILKATVYAYLRGKIPLLLTVQLFDTTNTPNESMGLHAVAVAGCSLKKGHSSQFDQTGFLLKAISIDRLYAHDDQIGPFARMEIDGRKIKVLNNNNILVEVESLSTSWRGKNRKGPIGKGWAAPEYLLIPLHNKIRIPFNTVLDSVYVFDDFLNTVNTHSPSSLFKGRLEWEIYLTTVNEFKADTIKNQTPKDLVERLKILTKRMPRFLWVAKSCLDGTPFFDLIFDATGIEQGNLIVRVVEHNQAFHDEIRELTNSGGKYIQQKLQMCNILKWFHSHP